MLVEVIAERQRRNDLGADIGVGPGDTAPPARTVASVSGSTTVASTRTMTSPVSLPASAVAGGPHHAGSHANSDQRASCHLFHVADPQAPLGPVAARELPASCLVTRWAKSSAEGAHGADQDPGPCASRRGCDDGDTGFLDPDQIARAASLVCWCRSGRQRGTCALVMPSDIKEARGLRLPGYRCSRARLACARPCFGRLRSACKQDPPRRGRGRGLRVDGNEAAFVRALRRAHAASCGGGDTHHQSPP